MNEIVEIAEKPGRRRSAADQRKVILEAAAQAFFESGFEGTSIDTIIERVGGSKRAVYAHFGSKRDLFAAIVTENFEHAFAPMEAAGLPGHDLRTTLEVFGRRLFELLVSQDTASLMSLMMGEGRRFPDLAKAFYENGPGRAALQLAAVLADHRDRGEIELVDCHAAAEFFIGMLRGNLQIGITLGARKRPGKKKGAEIVRQAVEIFLRGIQQPRAGA